MRITNDLNTYGYHRTQINFTKKITIPDKVVNKVSDVPKKGLKHIANSLYGELSYESQLMVKSINESLNKIEELFNSISKNKQTQTNIKSRYINNPETNMVPVKAKTKGYTFKTPEEGLLVKVWHKTGKKNLTRISYGAEGDSTHILIDGYDKIVANLLPNFPSFIPLKLRYMTSQQIKESNAEKYIAIIDEELQSFKTYLENYEFRKWTKPREKGQSPVKTVIAKKIVNSSKGVNAAPKVAAQITSSEKFSKKLVKLLDTPLEQLPKHLNPIVAPSGKVVGFNMKLDSGSIKITKKMNGLYKESLPYLSIEEFQPLQSTQYINIDLINGRFLKTGANGRPIILNNKVFHYTPEDLKNINLAERLNKYMNEIFSVKTDMPESTQEITRLEAKKPPKQIKEITLEDIEDPKLNKLLDKESAKRTRIEELSDKPDDEIVTNKKYQTKPHNRESNKVVNNESEQINLSKITEEESSIDDVIKQLRNDLQNFQTGFLGKVLDVVENVNNRVENLAQKINEKLGH